MVRILIFMGVALVPLLGAANWLRADELPAGLRSGQSMLAIEIEKRGGLDDGVRVGDAICYT